MILDSLLQFSDSQALTTTGAVSTNVIQLDSVQKIGIGEPMAAVVTVGVAADFTTTDETYQFTLQTATDSAFTTPVTIFATGAIDGDELPLGTKVVIPVGHTNLQFLRVNYTLAGTTPLITVDAFLQPLTDIDGVVLYPDNINIT